ncbi:MAG: NAD-dependent epimerase/dehydratase family protein [Chthonomonas sp.]|nr:NAD-dependent epimerase/dehydratase family protein [Chthonomonas sp.]
MRTLVVGADGFIGRHLMPLLDEPCAFDGDIRDPHAVQLAVEQFQPDTIINLAGVFRGSLADMSDVHLDGAANLRDAAGTCRILSAGSAAEYGIVPPRPVKEDFPCAPVSGYGMTKFLATQALGEDATVFRPSNVIGPGMSPDLLLGNVIRQLKKGEATIEVSALHTIRDYVDVNDVASAIVALVQLPPGIYNVSSGVGTSTDALLATLRQVSERDFAVTTGPVPTQSSELDVFIADSSKLQSLGWRPLVSLEQSVRATWEAA